MEAKKEATISEEDLAKIFNDTTLPKYYASAFIMGNSATDMFIVPAANGKPQLLLNISFSAAKELQRLLAGRILEIEKNIGYEIKRFETKK